MKKGKLYIGTSNVVLPMPRSASPEAFQSLSRLAYYSTVFNSVELNCTFYKMPMPKTFARWSSETRPEFRFTAKLSREVTHQKPLRYDAASIDRFFTVSKGLADKKGCLLVQFPASITEEYYEPVEAILKRIRRINVPPKWLVFTEFRHDSWYAEHVYTMLSKLYASVVIHDKRGSKTPLIDTRFPAVYVRFHGPRGDYRGTYTQEALLPYATKICGWLAQGKDVYVYFNNTMGTAFYDAQLLRSMCA